MEKYCPKCFKKFPPEAERCPDDGSYLVSPMDKDLTGQVLDERYTVMERIGRGGMGVVYKAEQHLIKRVVALKVLRREIVQDETAVKRFLNEARAIASLDSRHTVTLHDFGVTRDGLLYYTMELLKGRSLARVIRAEAPIDHVRAAGLMVQACKSLEEAHKNGILHRDIKPDNLFITEKEGREHLKVLDFGVAKLVGDAAMDTVTRTGMIVGTPQYLSPEQALGNQVEAASDLYSLGIVLYEMLAGVPPFQDETPMKTMWAQIRDPLPPIRQKNPAVEVPRSIEEFLAKALEKDPGARFPTAAEFADALRAAVEAHVASPATVSLPGLSTTDQGLRLKTQQWEAASARPAKDKAEGTHGASGPARRDARQDFDEPGPATLERILRGPRRWYWGGAAAVAVLLAVGFVWAPWKDGAPTGGGIASEHATDAPDSAQRVEGAGKMTGEGKAVPVDKAETARIEERAKKAEQEKNGGETKDAEMVKTAEEEAKKAKAKTADEEAKKAEALAAAKTADEEAKKLAAKTAEEEAKKADALAAAGKAAEEAKKAEDLAAEAKAAEEAKKAEEIAAEAKAAEEAKKAEETAAEAKAAEETEKKKAEEEARKAAAKKAEEEAKKAAAKKTEEEAKLLAAMKMAELAKEEKAAAYGAENDQYALVAKGRKAMDAGRYEDAISLFSQAKGKGADAGKMDDLTRKCYDGIRQREVGDLVRKGNQAIQRKDWKECVKHMEGAVKLGGSTSDLENKLKLCKEMAVFD